MLAITAITVLSNPAGLNQIINKVIRIEAKMLFIINFRTADRFTNQWIGIFAVPAIIQIPGLMVDPGAEIGDLLHRRTNPTS